MAFGASGQDATAGVAASAGSRDKASEVAAAASPSPTDRIIVRYRDQASARKSADTARVASGRVIAAALQRGLNARQLHTTGRGAQVWGMDRKMTYAEALALSKQIALADPEVEYAEPDLILRPTMTPNDPYYSLQPDLSPAIPGINVPSAWDRTSGSGVVVAVTDTGYRPHYDLAANLLSGYDFVSAATTANDGDGRDSDAQDPGDWCANDTVPKSSWHGTHVAGTIGAVTNNGMGIAGVAYGAKLQPVRVLGQCGGYSSDIADGIAWAAGVPITGAPSNPTPARVINMSLGGLGSCNNTFAEAVKGARQKGAIVVVAAGNWSIDTSNFTPANCPGVVTVASLSPSGARSSFSNYGPEVALAAPGEQIYSTYNTGTTIPGSDTFGYLSGTSMATPHVAGVAALMLSANPSLGVDAVSALLRSSSKPFSGSCTGCGVGMLDAASAVNAAVAYGKTNHIDESSFFVQQLYFDVLRRRPDDGGLNYFVSVLNGCNGDSACLTSRRASIALSMLQSQEARALYPELDPAAPGYNDKFVNRCYTVFLQRFADMWGSQYWTYVLNNSGTYTDVVSGMITSSEYRQRFGTP